MPDVAIASLILTAALEQQRLRAGVEAAEDLGRDSSTAAFRVIVVNHPPMSVDD
jgi:ABC-type spermidine/putrescine transport system permease subunit II